MLRPQNGYYTNLIDEAADLMESLSNNHAFLDRNKRTSFVMTDVLLRLNGYCLSVATLEAHKFMTEAMEKNAFRFPMIREWTASVVKRLDREQ